MVWIEVAKYVITGEEAQDDLRANKTVWGSENEAAIIIVVGH